MAGHPREYTDTDSRAMDVWLDVLRRMTPEDRFARALELNALAQRVSEAGVRSAHPGATDREVFLRAAARRLPRDWMLRVYGWDPEQHAQPR